MSDNLRHYEDFPVGEAVTSGAYLVTVDEIKEFAREFDPQPFHLDEEAAAKSVLGGLCASGWHSCSIMNRLLVDDHVGKSAAMGSFGMEEVRWLQPVYPGDTLSLRRTVLEKRLSKRRPEMGILKLHWELLDQKGVLKLDSTGYTLTRVRGAAQ